MPEYSAGDAKLRIVPDAQNFQKELQARLDAMNVDFKVKVNLNISQAKADMDRFRSQEETKAIGQRVNPQLSRAREEMAAFRAEQRAFNIRVPVDIDTNGARAAGSRAGKAAKDGLKEQLGKIGDEIGKMFGAGADLGKTIGLLGLITNIPAAVTAVVSLTSVIEQLGGAALAVPGAIGGMVSSFGTMAVGVMGMSDALSALSAASDTSVSKTNSITSANQSLQHAVEDEVHAQKDVTQARKDALHQLQDLNVELHGGKISEAQAVNDLAKARRDLAKGGFKDQLDYNDAVLRVDSSMQRLVEVHNQNIDLQVKSNDANAKGVEGADAVVSAKEREVRALEAIASAQQSITAAGGLDKVADAMAKLSPAAGEVVNTIAALKPQWQDLEKLVSGNMFAGVSGSLTTFVNSVLPNFRTGMGAIGTAWNSTIKTLLGSLGSDNSKGLLDRLLGNTANAQTKFSAAIDPLVRGIGTLTAAGSDALPRMADAIGKVAERFATFITAADKDGRLKGWIDKGLTGFADLGNILLNIGKMFHSIDEALGDATGGKGLLGSFKDLTAKWAAWMGSTEGQNKLVKFFKEGKAEIDSLKPIVQEIIQILPQVWEAAKTAFDQFLPIIHDITSTLAGHPQLIRDIGEAFVAWKAFSAVSRLATGLTAISDLLGRKGGKGGKGGAGILGKLGLLGIATLAVETLNNDGSTPPDATNPDGTPAPPAAPSPSTPGSVDPGSLPAGQSVPFGSVPTISPKQAAAVAIGAGTGAAVAPGPLALPGALAGGLLAAPGIQAPTGPQADLATILSVIPQLDDANAKQVADLFGVSVDELRSLSRDELVKRYNDKVAAEVPGHALGGPTNAGLAVLHDDEFVLSARANKYPMGFKHALNEGRIDPKMVPHFENGGPWPPEDPTKPIAPNPSGGGVASALGRLGAGLQGPLTNAIKFAGGGGGGGRALGLGMPTSMGFGPPLSPVPSPSLPGVTGDAPKGAPFPTDAAGGGGPAVIPATPGAHTDYKTAGPKPLPDVTNPALFDPATGTYGPPLPKTPSTSATPSTPIPGQGPLPGPNAPDSVANIAGNVPEAIPGTDPTAPQRRLQVWENADGSVKPIEQIMAGLPDKLKPFNIAAQFGQIALGFVSGFLGLDTSYLQEGNKVFGDINKLFGSGAGGDGTTNPLPDGAVAYDSNGNIISSPWSPGSTTNTTGTKTNQMNAFINSMIGTPYVPGGNTAAGTDCSGLAAMVSNIASGREAFSGRFATGSEGEQLAARGFKPGRGGAGSLTIGWNASHTAVTLPDGTSVSSGEGNGQGVQRGGGGANEKEFTNWMYLPVDAGATPLLTGLPGASAPPGPWSTGGNDPRKAVYAAMKAAGFADTEWNALSQLVGHESSWSPTAQNPTSTAFGLFQFLDSTWAGTGAAKSGDPAAQAAAGMTYIKNTYGTPSAAWAFWQHPTRAPFDQNWYDSGGWLPTGLSMAHNDSGKPEAVLTHAQGKALQAMAPHFELGGPFDTGLVDPRRPLPRPPDAQRKVVPPTPPAPSKPSPVQQPGPSQGPTQAPAGPPPAAAAAPGPAPTAPSSAPGPSGESMHLLPAVETGIKSGFDVAGNIAGAAASMGMGGMGGGAASSMISGAFKQFGKIATNVANVGASMLVGSVPGSFGDPNLPAGGAVLSPAQKQPQTAADNYHTRGGNTTNWNIQGVDHRTFFDEVNLRESQQMQAQLATF